MGLTFISSVNNHFVMGKRTRFVLVRKTGERSLRFYFFCPLSSDNLQFVSTSKLNGAVKILAWACKANKFFPVHLRLYCFSSGSRECEHSNKNKILFLVLLNLFLFWQEAVVGNTLIEQTMCELGEKCGVLPRLFSLLVMNTFFIVLCNKF